MATPKDTVIPRYQGGALVKLRVVPTSGGNLPRVIVSVADGPFYFQGYLDPQEARNLADLLYEVADGLACERCHGNGEVRINRSHVADPQEDEDVECPACEGSGRPAEQSSALAQIAEQIG